MSAPSVVADTRFSDYLLSPRWSPGRLAWRALVFMVREPITGAAIVICSFFVFVAVFPQAVTSYDPLEIDVTASSLDPFSGSHILGTDQLGRDTLSRLAYGTRLTLAMAVIPVLIASVAASFVGLLAGWYRGPIDAVLMRISEVFMSMPALILSLSVVAMLGPSISAMIIALTIPTVPDLSRMVRQQVIVVERSQYIAGARAIGASDAWILARHVFPNVLPVLLVLATLRLSSMVFAASALSFLGAGVTPPEPDWGNVVADGARMMAVSPWQATVGGFVVFVCMLSFTLAAEGIREAADPLTSRR